MADAADSKSADGNIVRVQVPPSAPKNTAEKDTFSAVFFYPLRKQWYIIAVRCISSP